MQFVWVHQLPVTPQKPRELLSSRLTQKRKRLDAAHPATLQTRGLQSGNARRDPGAGRGWVGACSRVLAVSWVLTRGVGVF